MSQGCRYQNTAGVLCGLPAGPHHLCKWHDPTQAKQGPLIRDEFEQLVRQHPCMQGMSLQRSPLAGINLVKHGQAEGFDLSMVDFYRADLRNAHLFHINLKGASLMKADLREANLHFANLEQCNLLGAKLDGAKIENVQWGEQLLQEQKATEAMALGDKTKAHDFYEQSEEICRHIRKVAENQGLFEIAGWFFHKEMIMRRKQMPKFSIPRLIAKLVDLFCGYGERPLRVISFSLILIVCFALLYFSFGVVDGGQPLHLDWQAPLLTNLKSFLSCLYYSVVTFTTLGYGDIIPQGFSRFIAAVEAFIGSFTLALFVVVFVKKMTR